MLPFQRKGVSGWLVLSEYGLREATARLSLAADSVYIVPPIAQKPPREIGYKEKAESQYILALGHLEKRKNLEVLIKAVSTNSWPEAVELWVAGNDHGAQRELEELAFQMGSNSVKFLGPVEDGMKWQLLQEALLVAVPSTIEGFGIVAIEAPGVGVPVLVSDQSALPEIAGHPLAIVKAHDERAWSDRIRQLIENEVLYSEIVQAQRKQLESFDSKSVIKRLLGVYRSIQSDSHGSIRSAV